MNQLIGVEIIKLKNLPVMIYNHKDDKDPNKNVQVNTEVYQAQKKR